MLLKGWYWCCQCPAAAFYDTEVKPAFAEHPGLAEQAEQADVYAA